MGLELITPPALEPVSLAEAKQHLRVDDVHDDTYILNLITAGREYAETYTGRVFITQTWEYHLDYFPVGGIIMPKPKLQSVTSIKYIDTAGDEQTLDTGDYWVDTHTRKGRVMNKFSWPSTYDQVNAVTIRFVAGYGSTADDVPAGIRQAILVFCADAFDNRETFSKGVSMALNKFTVDALLNNHKIMWMG